MHPFGGPAICPRCSKTVYAAEQVIGPGRKLYHKPCLACMICNKRLDSYTLLEHDQAPYCKPCHVKNFGTRDLRSANLPHRATSVPPRSPTLSSSTVSRPRSVSPEKRSRVRPVRDFPAEEDDDEARDTISAEPLSPTFTNNKYDTFVTLGRSNSSTTAAMMEKVGRPLMQTATGTRYGAALGGKIDSPVRKFGGTVPSCPRCNKSVYFAEQIKAVGKTFHKGCLRCDECGTSLDSSKLRDHEGTPFCNRCYNKLYGPAGNGYALLGKAGG